MNTPTESVDATYELLSFEPGDAPEWARFRELFVEDAVMALRVFPSDTDVSVLSLEDYFQSQLRHNLQEEGYSETPGERDIDLVGRVATVRQAFTMNFAGRAPVGAVDFFSLVHTPTDEWRIVSVVSDMATDG